VDQTIARQPVILDHFGADGKLFNQKLMGPINNRHWAETFKADGALRSHH
jgi:hypothetical protein